MTDLTVLVVGSGGREHALARAIAADPGVAAVHVAPGNPGTWHSWPHHVVDPVDGRLIGIIARRDLLRSREAVLDGERNRSRG